MVGLPRPTALAAALALLPVGCDAGPRASRGAPEPAARSALDGLAPASRAVRRACARVRTRSPRAQVVCPARVPRGKASMTAMQLFLPDEEIDRGATYVVDGKGPGARPGTINHWDAGGGPKRVVEAFLTAGEVVRTYVHGGVTFVVREHPSGEAAGLNAGHVSVAFARGGYAWFTSVHGHEHAARARRMAESLATR